MYVQRVGLLVFSMVLHTCTLPFHDSVVVYKGAKERNTGQPPCVLTCRPNTHTHTHTHTVHVYTCILHSLFFSSFPISTLQYLHSCSPLFSVRGERKGREGGGERGGRGERGEGREGGRGEGDTRNP